MTLNEQARTGLIKLMEKRGLTKTQLARRKGVTKGYITNLLHPDRKNLTLNVVEGVARDLGGTVKITVKVDPEVEWVADVGEGESDPDPAL